MDEETFASAFNAQMTNYCGEGWGGFSAAVILSYLIQFHNARVNESERLQLLGLDQSDKVLMKYPDLREAVKECRWSIIRSHREFAIFFSTSVTTLA